LSIEWRQECAGYFDRRLGPAAVSAPSPDVI